MLFAPDRCVFKITVFSCVVVSVFSDGRMGFYRGGWRCCVAGCVAASGCRLYGLRQGGVSFAGVFSRSGRLFSGGGVGGGGLTGRDMALKLRRLARGSKTALERECRVGVGVFFFSAFY